jgi:hypothetical protein
MPVFEEQGLTLEVDDSTQYATIYNAKGLPAGTVTRRRVSEWGCGPEWTVHTLSGREVGAVYRTVNLVRALRAIAMHG